jgi:hypothetical protein
MVEMFAELFDFAGWWEDGKIQEFVELLESFGGEIRVGGPD